MVWSPGGGNVGPLPPPRPLAHLGAAARRRLGGAAAWAKRHVQHGGACAVERLTTVTSEHTTVNGNLVSLAREVGKVGGKIDSMKEAVDNRLNQVDGKLKEIKADLSTKVSTGECERRHAEYARATDVAMRTIAGSVVEQELTPITEIVEQGRKQQQVQQNKVDLISLIKDNWGVVKVAVKLLLAAMAAVFGLGMLQANQQSGLNEMREQSKEQKRSILKEVSDLMREAVKPTVVPAPMPQPVSIPPDSGVTPTPRRNRGRSRTAPPTVR